MACHRGITGGVFFGMADWDEVVDVTVDVTDGVEVVSVAGMGLTDVNVKGGSHGRGGVRECSHWSATTTSGGGKVGA